MTLTDLHKDNYTQISDRKGVQLLRESMAQRSILPSDFDHIEILLHQIKFYTFPKHKWMFAQVLDTY